MIERLIWVVPLAVAALGSWRPRAGLVVLAAALPLFGSPPGGPYLAALDVAGLAAILTAWRGGRALRAFSDYRRYSSFQPSQDIRSLGVAITEVRWE